MARLGFRALPGQHYTHRYNLQRRGCLCIGLGGGGSHCLPKGQGFLQGPSCLSQPALGLGAGKK